MPRLRAVAMSLLLASAFIQAPPPATEVFLAALQVGGSRLIVGAPVNISNNPGYDNQPSFTPDGGAVLFTSVRGDRKPDPANSAATGSDVYRYDIGAGRLTQVTDTPESEYSPTVTPDGQHISTIRVERDGTQRLWRFALDGSAPQLVLADIKPVGYHAWADAQTLALFVLGEPATLQLADAKTGKAELIAKDIGRSIQRMPGGGISFVQRESREGAAVWIVMELTVQSKRAVRLLELPAGTAQPDLAWTPDGMLLMAGGGKLLGWKRGDARMSPVADLDALGLRQVSRLAVSPRADRLALVATR